MATLRLAAIVATVRAQVHKSEFAYHGPRTKVNGDGLIPSGSSPKFPGKRRSVS